jgi:hypothetical protein
MPDFLLRNIDERLAIRIKEYAREKERPLNDALLTLLARGLDAEAMPGTQGGTRAVEGEMRMLGGSWSADEAGAFQEALRALERIPK